MQDVKIAKFDDYPAVEAVVSTQKENLTELDPCEIQRNIHQRHVLRVGGTPGLYRLLPKRLHTCYSLPASRGLAPTSYELLQPVLVRVDAEEDPPGTEFQYHSEDKANGWRQHLHFSSPPAQGGEAMADQWASGPGPPPRIAVLGNLGHKSASHATPLQHATRTWGPQDPVSFVLLHGESQGDILSTKQR